MKKKILAAVIAVIILSGFIVYYACPGTVVSLSQAIERGRAGLVQKEVTVADHTMVYLDRENDGEAMLLLHGYGGDKDNWTRFVKNIPETYRVVVPDLPGFGESSKLENKSYDIRSQAERLEAFVSKAGLTRFHIAGNSMGGNLSGYYAYRYPRRVITLGLFDSSGVDEPVMSEAHRAFQKGENPLVVDSAEDFDRLMEYVMAEPPFIPGPLKEYFAERAVQNRSFYMGIMKDLRDKPAKLGPLLGKIKQPTLILWGDSDRIIDKSCVDVFKKGIPNSSAVIMENTGHMPMLEKPEKSAEVYLEFIDKSGQ